MRSHSIMIKHLLCLRSGVKTLMQFLKKITTQLNNDICLLADYLIMVKSFWPALVRIFIRIPRQPSFPRHSPLTPSEYQF